MFFTVQYKLLQFRRCIIGTMNNNNTRRDFLKQAGLLTAVAAFPAISLPEASDFIDQLGLQLYTVRDVLAEKPQETLEAIRNAGYKQVELYDSQLLPRLQPVLKSLGIGVNSTHFLSPLLTGNWQAVTAFGAAPPPADYTLQKAIDQAAEYGLSYFIFPFLYPQERGGLDDYKALAEKLNATGETCRQAGLQLGYHNHSFEFQPMDGASPMEVLLSETDPELLCLELDIFWVSVAGLDPAAYIRQHANRIQLLHLKDKKKDTPPTYRAFTLPPESFQPVGSGVIDVAKVLEAAQESGVKYVFVEQDVSSDPLADIQKSSKYLQNL